MGYQLERGALPQPSASNGRQWFERQGLTALEWGNAPHDRYSTHLHDYHKILLCVQGSVTFVTSDGSVELRAGDRLDLEAGTAHSAVVGPEGVACLEAHMPSSVSQSGLRPRPKGVELAVTLEAGDQAPGFQLQDQDGVAHRLADYRGRVLVLYFYPKDNTPGCTKEACSFRDEYVSIRARGVEVLGVSTDSAASHTKFREQHSLPFPLLVDESAKVATAYGAWGEKTLYGRTSVGMIRSTFIIGPDGQLLRVWKRAKADGHGEVVRKALDALGIGTT